MALTDRAVIYLLFDRLHNYPLLLSSSISVTSIDIEGTVAKLSFQILKRPELVYKDWYLSKV